MLKRLLWGLIFLCVVGCNDTTRVFFDVDSQSVTERAGFAEISLKLNRSSKIGVGDFNSPNSVSNREIKVPFTVSGTAVYGTNHGLADGTVVFPPNSRVAKIRVPVYHNVVFEGDKTVVVTLGNPEGAILGDLVTHTLTITETDLSPAIDFSSAAQSVSEGAGTASVPLVLEYASEADAVISYSFSGTAVEGVDFTAPSSVTILAGQTTGSIPITIIDNLVINANKTIVVDLVNPNGAHLGTLTTHTMTVVDNDNQPTVSFTTATQTVAESVGTVTVSFSMNKTYLLDVDIPYTVSGTASNPQDHNLSNGTLTITPGNVSGSVTFNVVNDSLDEANETVIVTMGTVVNGNVGSPSTQTITITDDDATPTVQFSAATQTVSEGVGTVTVRVNLSAVSGQTVLVPYTVSGTATNPADHDFASGTLTIPAGSTFVTTTFNVVNDSLYETNETVIVTLGTPTNATASGTTVQTITFTDNDAAPTVNFTASAQSLNEGDSGSTTVTATVQLSAVSGVTTTIPFSVSGTATNGTDFLVTTTSPLSIASGSTTTTISVSITGDTTYENNETVVLTLGSPTNGTLGATTTHTITVNNDDPVPTVSFSASAQTVTESAGTVYILFVMTNASDFTVTIPFTVTGTASYPSDHDLQSGNTTITAGNTSRVFTFNVVNDAVTEATETVILSIGAVTNGTLGTPSTHTVSITDNDRKFSLQNTKVWLDASYGVLKDSQNQVLEWSPRFSKKPLSISQIPETQWIFDPWLKFPLIESRNWECLSSAFESRYSFSDKDFLYAVYGEKPQKILFNNADALPWLRGFEGELSEVLWVTADPDEKNLDEIDSYLDQKYKISYDG